jgi:hypothetical protein
MLDELVLQIVLGLIEYERICTHLKDDGEESSSLLSWGSLIDGDQVAALSSTSSSLGTRRRRPEPR